LYAASIRGRSRVKNGFDLIVFFFAFNDLGGWSGVVGAMLGCFFVRGEKGIVKDGVDSP
jgi:hypothetical protein